MKIKLLQNALKTYDETVTKPRAYLANSNIIMEPLPLLQIQYIDEIKKILTHATDRITNFDDETKKRLYNEAIDFRNLNQGFKRFSEAPEAPILNPDGTLDMGEISFSHEEESRLYQVLVNAKSTLPICLTSLTYSLRRPEEDLNTSTRPTYSNSEGDFITSTTPTHSNSTYIPISEIYLTPDEISPMDLSLSPLKPCLNHSNPYLPWPMQSTNDKQSTSTLSHSKTQMLSYDNMASSSDIEQLPTEALVNLFSFFNNFELSKISQVSKCFHQIATDKQVIKNAAPILVNYSYLIKNEYPTNLLVSNSISCIVKLCPQIIAVSHSNNLDIWDLRTCDNNFDISNLNLKLSEPIHQLTGHQAFISAVITMPGNNIVSASYDKTLRVWNIETGECINTVNTTDRITHLAQFSKNTVAISMGQTMQIRNIETGQVIASFNHDQYYTTNEKAYARPSYHNMDGAPTSIIYIAKLCETKVLSLYQYGKLIIWDTESCKPSSTLDIPVPASPTIIECAAILSKSLIAIGFSNGEILIINFLTNEKIHLLSDHKDAIHSITKLSEQTFVSSSGDRTLRIWESSTGKCIQTIKDIEKHITTCVASHLNKLITGISNDRSLKGGRFGIFTFPMMQPTLNCNDDVQMTEALQKMQP